MKRFLALILVLLFAGDASPSYLGHRRKAWRSVGGGGGATYLVQQDFEGTGYDNSETWTESGLGTANEDDTTSPSPLVGSQSLRATSSANTVRVESPNFTAISEIHGYLVFNPVNTATAGNTRKFITLENSGGGSAEGIILTDGDSFTITHGGASATIEDAFTENTTIHFWFRWKAKVGAADGEAEIWWSTDSTKPGAGTKHQGLVNGTGSGTAMRAIAIGCAPDDSNVSWTVIYDKVRVDDEAIGSAPE